MANSKNYMDINLIDKKNRGILPIILKNKIFIGIIAGILVTAVFCFFAFLYHLNNPLDKNGQEKIFIIEQRQGLEEVAKNLKTDKVISSKWTFILYIWFQNKSKNLQAGEYGLSAAMNIPEIAKKIIDGNVIRDWIKVTIPEGWTNRQIKDRLVSLGIVAKGSKLSEELEGYLFPDTYYFEKDVSIEEVVERMRNNFNNKVTDELRSEIEKQDKALYDILIVASLLEKEVKSDDDRVTVSGIFWQRLKDRYPLESCATIAYILGVDKWRYSYQDTRIESSYNTYINVGLPPTPINNPGLSAIKAAIYPEETNYYFFLTDPATGNTIFSKTFEEHSINKRKYF